MQNRGNIDGLICDLLGGCAVNESALISSIHVGDAAYQISPSAERIVKLVDSIVPNSLWMRENVRAQGPRVLLVFESEFQSCGEIHTRDGMFGRAMLTGPGEEAIGERMREWQLRGVPRVLSQNKLSPVLIETRVPLRDPAFHIVTILWLGSQGYRVLDAPSVLLGVWQRIIHQVDSDEARFKTMEKATRVPLSELGELFTISTKRSSNSAKKIPVQRTAAPAKKKKTHASSL